jgi:hypothetical protein
MKPAQFVKTFVALTTKSGRPLTRPTPIEIVKRVESQQTSTRGVE